MAINVKYIPIGDINIQGSQLFDTIDPVNVPTPVEGKLALFNDSTNGNKLSKKDSEGVVEEVGGGSGGISMAVYHWEIPITTGGIKYSTGAWTRFPLNTEQFSNITDANIDTTTNIGRITLPAGTYKISSHAARDNQGHMHIRIYDITNTSTLINGQQQQGDGGVVSRSATSFLSGVIALTGTTDIEFQYYTDNATDETYNVIDAGIPRVSAFIDISKIA